MFPQIYALYCPILEQYKVSTRLSKKSTKCSKGRGRVVKGTLNNVEKTARLVKRDIPILQSNYR